MHEQFITIGEIVNTQGNRGEVRVLPLTDFPDRFNNLKELFILKGTERLVYHISTVRSHKRFVVIKFAEVKDMNDGEKLKGCLIQITMDMLEPLPEGHYYIFQLIGLEVFETSGELLGRLDNVLKTGANDVYVIKPPSGKDILIPALKTVVKEIDIEANRMLVELPEGLLD